MLFSLQNQRKNMDTPITVGHQTLRGTTVLPSGKEVTEYLPPGPYHISGPVYFSTNPSPPLKHDLAFVFFSYGRGPYYVLATDLIK
jgi:hypothetical protein